MIINLLWFKYLIVWLKTAVTIEVIANYEITRQTVFAPALSAALFTEAFWNTSS